MSLDYIVTKRIFGFDETETEQYVVTPLSSGEVTFEKLCTQVNQICGVHRGTVQLVVAGVIDAIINNIDDGKSVRLGDFGIFRPSIRTKAASSAEEANASRIYRRKIQFTPGKAFKNALKDMAVTRYTLPASAVTDGGNGGSQPGTDPGDGGFEDPNA